MSVKTGIELSTREIREAYPDLPPILTLEQAAKVAHASPNTLKRHVHEGKYTNSVKSGKPLRFWMIRFVKEYMAG
jgi:hypothetical protein